MPALYFALVAILLYFLADWVVDRVERAAGRRFEHRSVLFFAVLLALAMLVFAAIHTVSDPASG